MPGVAASDLLYASLARDDVFRAAGSSAVAPSISSVERELARLRGVAALLSVAGPGLGQIYERRPIAGLLWFGSVAVGYWVLPLLGIVLHTICVVNASTLGVVAQLNHALLADGPPVFQRAPERRSTCHAQDASVGPSGLAVLHQRDMP